MITDFISVKQELDNRMNILLREMVKKKMPFLSSIGKKIQHEGDRASYQTVNQEERNLDYKVVKGDFKYTRHEMNKLTLRDIQNKIIETAENIAEQMERGAFKSLAEEIEKAGNIIEGNPKLSPKAILQALEKVQIDFINDNRETPKLPTIVAHPTQIKKLFEQDAKQTPEEKEEYKKKEQQILDIKYKEYMEREGKRKLID